MKLKILKIYHLQENIYIIINKLTFLNIFLQPVENKASISQNYSNINYSNHISKKNTNGNISKYNEMQLMKKINKEFDERCLKIVTLFKELKMKKKITKNK